MHSIYVDVKTLKTLLRDIRFLLDLYLISNLEEIKQNIKTQGGANFGLLHLAGHSGSTQATSF